MPDPLYRQIAEDLQQKIASGELAPGTRLPSEIELREQYNASRNTVRDAVKLLTGRSLVETRPGQGTFVVEKMDPFVMSLTLPGGFGGDEGTTSYEYEVAAKSRRPTVSPPRIEIHQAAGAVASELQLDDGSTVVSRHQERFIDNIPWSLQTTFYPMSYVEGGATELLRAVDMVGGVGRYLEETLGIKQVGWRDKITVRPPDGTEAAFFRLPDDGRVSVFENHRISFEESGKPLRLTISAYPVDRNQFVMDVGQVPADALRRKDA